METTAEALDLKQVFERHMAELAEERTEADSIYGLLVGGRARIESEQHAALVVRAFADLAGERDRVEAQHEARLARIDGKERSLRYLFENALASWTAAHLTGKRKSIILPDGTVGMRTVKGGIKTESDITLREWAKVELPQAFNYDRAPLLVQIVKDWETKHGKTAPGRIMVDDEERFYLKVESKTDTIQENTHA